MSQRPLPQHSSSAKVARKSPNNTGIKTAGGQPIATRAMTVGTLDSKPVKAPPRPSRSKPEESATKRSFAAEDFAAKHAEKELRRQRQRTAVLNELISTEQAYVEDLGIIVIELLMPLRVGNYKNLLSMEDQGRLFSNVELIMRESSELLSDMSEIKQSTSEDAMVGDIFTRRIKYLIQLYTHYCMNQTTAMTTYTNLSKRKNFREFVKQKTFNTPACRGLDLVAFIVKPVQRLCKYPLLLRELIKCTPEDHPDRTNLETTLAKMENLVQTVNKSSREAQNVQKILEVESLIDGAKHITFVVPGRRYIMDERFRKKSGNKIQARHFFLFSDMIIYAAPKATSSKYQFKGLIAMSDCTISREPDDSEAGLTHAIRIERRDVNKSYIVAAEAANIQNDWLKAIGDLTQDVATPTEASENDESQSVMFGMETAASSASIHIASMDNRIAGFRSIAAQHLRHREDEFIREGAVTVFADNQQQERHLFLFTPVLLICKKHSSKAKKGMHVKECFALSDVGVQDINRPEVPHGLALIDGNIQRVVFSFNSESGKKAWWSDFQETIKKNKLMKERRVKTTAVGAASISSDSGGKYDFASSIPHLSDEDWKALMGSGTKMAFKQGEVILEDGAKNEAIYRVLTGKVRVEKGDQFLANMVEGAHFGEMSFIGSKFATASVLADESFVELQRLENTVLHSIFLANESLFLKFYWTLVRNLAARLKEIPTRKRNNTNEVASSEKRVVEKSMWRIYLDTDVYKTISFDQATSFSKIRQQLRMKVEDHEQRKFYEMSDEIAPIQIDEEEAVAMHVRPNARDGTYRIYFSVTPPKARFEEKFSLSQSTIIKVFPCKLKKQGNLYITSTHAAHSSKTLGFERLISFPFREINKLTREGTSLLISMVGGGKTITLKFSKLKAAEDCIMLIETLRKKVEGRPQTQRSGNRTFRGSTVQNDDDEDTCCLPSEQEWKQILLGGQEVHFQKDKPVISKGMNVQRVYQILNGKCRVEIEDAEGVRKTVDVMKEGEVFGELSLILGGETTADVVADCEEGEEVVVFCLDGGYLKKLVHSDLRLGGKIFHYLCKVIEARVRARQTAQ